MLNLAISRPYSGGLVQSFNTVLTVWKPGGFSRESHRKVFLVQLTLSLLLPGGKFAFALINGQKYVGVAPCTIVCSPESDFWDFYLFMLPADVTIFCSTLMSIFVMVKLHQVRERIF